MGHLHISIYSDEYSFTLIWDESAGTQWGSKGKDKHTWRPSVCSLPAQMHVSIRPEHILMQDESKRQEI